MVGIPLEYPLVRVIAVCLNNKAADGLAIELWSEEMIIVNLSLNVLCLIHKILLDLSAPNQWFQTRLLTPQKLYGCAN